MSHRPREVGELIAESEAKTYNDTSIYRNFQLAGHKLCHRGRIEPIPGLLDD